MIIAPKCVIILATETGWLICRKIPEVLNNGKKEFAEEGDMNFVVNSSWQYEGGLKLQVNESASGVDHGGVGGQHYWARDMFKLGMEYANIIVDNNLVD